MTSDRDTDRTIELLKQALNDEAATVNPGPGGLQEIQARTAQADVASRRTRRRWLLVTPLGAGLAAAAVIFGIVLVNGGTSNGGEGPPAVTQPQQHRGVYDPNAPASEQFTMWYVGPQPDNPQLKPRLFAETHTVTNPGDDSQLAAVRELLTSTPIDPDYRNPWTAQVDVESVSESAGVTTFALSTHDADPAGRVSALPLAELARQMLARTAGLEPGDAFALRFDGTGDDVAYTVAPDDDVRAWISIDNIVDGQTVTNPVTVQVSGNVFEGTVNWQLLDASGNEVDSGFVTTSMGMWTQVPVELGTLDPGTYTLRAIELSAEDGSPINIDDKTFVVD